MYTIDCEDPNCVKCKHPSEGPNSGMENQKKIMIEALLSSDLLLASNKKAFCLEERRKIKDEIHYRISHLIGVLRERERDLCIQVEQECCTEMAKIDHDATVQCIDKLLKRNSEPEKAPCRTKLVFKCEFDSTLWNLKKFGYLHYEDPMDHLTNGPVKETQDFEQQLEKSDRTLLQNNDICTIIPLDSSSIAANDESLRPEKNEDMKLVYDLQKFTRDLQKNIKLKRSTDEEQRFEECTDLESSEEIAIDILSSSDEDDIEFISKNEVTAVPSVLLPLPTKHRFRFGRKPLCFPSLFSKKNFLSPDKLDSLCHPPLISAQEPSQKCLSTPESSIISNSKDIQQNLTALTPMAEKKEILCSRECLADSSADSQGHDLSASLLSSLKKYLEKNPDGEWLAPVKSSNNLMSSENSLFFNSHLPFVVENLDQWLSTKN